MARRGKARRPVRGGAVAVILAGAMLAVMVPGGAEALVAKPLSPPLAVLIPLVGLAFLEGKAQTAL
ncbi:hypothetical protein S101_22875 [Salmonella enterica subsp. enterica serovar Tennessee]|nr:hypothetical protein S101_22875 [Salmonella enterica subsp. enterica serovar Tennessee]